MTLASGDVILGFYSQTVLDLCQGSMKTHIQAVFLYKTGSPGTRTGTDFTVILKASLKSYLIIKMNS